MFLSKPMLGTQIDWSNPLNDGAVLDLLMNEGHGDRVNDLSGYGNHGTLHGFDFPPTKTSGWNPGADGIALQFDGVDDYITCGNNPILDLTDAFTILASVIYTGPGTANNTIFVGNADDGDVKNDFYLSSNRLYYDNFPPLDGKVVSNTDMSTGVLHRIGVTKNGSNITFYLDGHTDGGGTADVYSGDPTTNYLIGARYYSSSPQKVFHGSIARLRILPRAMSEFEVMQTQTDPYGVYLQ